MFMEIFLRSSLVFPIKHLEAFLTRCPIWLLPNENGVTHMSTCLSLGHSIARRRECPWLRQVRPNPTSSYKLGLRGVRGYLHTIGLY